jgi:tetratricopeptide (TPR) repeat protein/tRNA A-37 threonylcarbamoyl transferase component Bud32
MPDHRPGEGSEPILPRSATNSGSAPTIDPSVPQTEPTGTDLPERIGRFVIRGFLGAGAFGTVYRAYDPQLDREIALKVARSAGQSPERMQRFRREARAAAGLRHPHIVPLFEAGEADGHLFLASAFVPGMTLEETIDKQGGTRLPAEQTAVIVRKLADALAYAHSQGVLHRDVKSANILLDPTGEPHLLDFGLARRTDEQVRMTVDGSVLGTAAYLAPEAAKGDQSRWTPAADQYALGVVLYELLTGHTPFTGPVELVLALHQTQEPERPSRRNREVPRDLDAICLKCLEKDPAHRYPTTGDLAADLDRFHRGEPVLARRQTMRYLAGKFVRRYRRPLLTAAVVMVLLLVGSAAAFWQILEERNEAVAARVRADEEEQKARDALAASEANRVLAEQRFDEKRQAMDSMLAQFSDKRLSGMPGTQQIRKVLFERGVELYEGIFREKQNDPAVVLSLADRYGELGRLQSEIGTLEQALEPLKKGEKVLRRLVKQEPSNPHYRYRLGVVLYQIGYCCWQHRNTKPGIAALREAVAILSKLSQGDPKNFDYALHLARSQKRLAASMTGWSKERLDLTKTACESLEQLVAQRQKNAQALLALARVTTNLGFRAADTGKYAEAEKFFEKARLMAQRALDIDPSDRLTYDILKVALGGLGQVYGKTNRVAKGIELLTGVVGDLVQLTTANPAVLDYQRSLVWVHDDLRKLYQRSGDYDKAIASLQEIVRIADALAQRDPQNPQHAMDSIDASQGVADICRTRKREPEAVVALDKVIKQADQVMRLHPTSDKLLGKLLWAQQIRGELSSNVQQHEKAREIYQGGVDLYTRHRPTLESPSEYTYSRYFQCCRGLIQIAGERKQTNLVIALTEKLIVPIKLDTFADGDNKVDVLFELRSLAVLYEDTSNVEKALRLRELIVAEARKILRGNPKSNWYAYQLIFGSHLYLARLYQKTRDQRREFEAIRSYLKETQAYVDGRDHSKLLAETADFTPNNLTRLREACTQFFSKENLKRFTIPVDWDGIKYGSHVYVAESWQFLDDQFSWFENVRGGKVPADVVDSFRRLYKIAKENKVSFVDLCVYALSTASGQTTDENSSPIARSGSKTDVTEILKELASARAEIQTGKVGPDGRKKLALRYIRLAEEEIAATNSFRAGYLLDEARAHLGLNSSGNVRDPKDRDVLAYLQYVQGALLTCMNQAEKGYARVMESFRTEPENVRSAFAIPAGNREFALGWTCLKLNRPAEAALWYHRAMDLGHRSAAARLYVLCQGHPGCDAGLPDGVRKLLTRAVPDVSKKVTAAEAFARMVDETNKATKANNAAQFAELANLHRGLALDLLRQSKREQALEAFQKEAGLLARQADLVGKNDELDKARARVAYDVARIVLELGKPEEAIKRLTEAQSFGSEEAVFALADLYEQGKVVKKDLEKANSIRASFLLEKGNRLYSRRRYSEAAAAFERSARLSSSVGVYRHIGRCQMRLDRFTDAVTGFEKAVELAKDFREGYWVVLDLLEAMTCAGRAADVLDFLEKMDRKRWKPEQTPHPHTVTAYLLGFRAIALRQTGKDPAGVEKQLAELLARPNLRVTRATAGELDSWPKNAKLPAERARAVTKIISSIDSKPSRPLTTPYFPLEMSSQGRSASGGAWVYKSSNGEQTTIRVARRQVVGEREYYRLETIVKGKVVGAVLIAVEEDGIYGRLPEGDDSTASVRLVALPPRDKGTWDVTSTIGFFALAGKAIVRVEEVIVPIARYADAVVVETKDPRSSTQTTTVWYARGVGPVKIVTQAGKSTTTLELEKVEKPRVENSR